MDIKEYISSGKLEDYILGTLSEQESKEVECLIQIYPELMDELLKVQIAFENYVSQFSEKPSRSIKERINKQISEEISTKKITSEEKTPIPDKKTTGTRTLSGLAIAASIALVISLVFNIRFMNQNNRMDARLDDLETRFDRLSETYEKTVEQNEKLAFKAQVLADPTYKIISMEGVEQHEESKAHVYWDTETKDVYVGVDQLPIPPENKQYQLWAIVDGQAVDAGVFEVEKDTTGLQKMKNIPKAEAFVVTLEKRGGVPVAEGDIYVMGNV